MRWALCLAGLIACAEPQRSRFLGPRPPFTPPRLFCAAIARGDLADASAAAAGHLSSTGVNVRRRAHRVAAELRRWFDAQACVARAEIDRCSAQRIAIDLQPWTHRRRELRAIVNDAGWVKLVDRTHLDAACGRTLIID